jgi:hypothetical protein
MNTEGKWDEIIGTKSGDFAQQADEAVSTLRRKKHRFEHS